MRIQKWKRESRRYKNKRITIKPKVYKRRIIKTDIAEQKIIIEQNSIFYCMQKRKDSRFRESGSCQNYTINIQAECMKKYDYGDLALTRCVKRKLR